MRAILRCYAVVVWRLGTRRQTSVLLRLSVVGYPRTSEDAARRPLQKLLWRLTLSWCVFCGAKAAATPRTLHAMSLHAFVAGKTVYTATVATLSAAVTVVLAVRVAHREGLLPAPARTSGLSGLTG